MRNYHVSKSYLNLPGFNITKMTHLSYLMGRQIKDKSKLRASAMGRKVCIARHLLPVLQKRITSPSSLLNPHEKRFRVSRTSTYIDACIQRTYTHSFSNKHSVRKNSAHEYAKLYKTLVFQINFAILLFSYFNIFIYN